MGDCGAGQAVRGGTPVSFYRLANKEAVEQRLRKRVLEMSLGLVPITLFDAAAQLLIIARLGPVLRVCFCLVALDSSVDVRARPLAPLALNVGGV